MSAHMHDQVRWRTHPLAIDRARYGTVVGADLSALVAKHAAVPVAQRAEAATRRAAAGAAQRAKGRQVIYLRGLYEGGSPGIYSMLGLGFNAERLAMQIKLAAIDDGVREILLSIDSPGGSTEAIPELIALLRKTGQTKVITGMVEYTCASAAYWIAAASCDRIVCAPSGQVGSIGVYMQHQDLSEMYRKAGISTTLISAGKHKTDGHSFGPLSKDAEAWQQRQVDRLYSAFITDVAHGRGVSVDKVRNGMGQGRMLSAQDALAEKMIDAVAADVDRAPTNSRVAAKRVAHASRV